MTCICGASIPADTYLCPSCAGRLDQHLGNVPAWVDELETTLTRTKAQAFDSNSPSATPGLHFNEKAGDLYRQLVTELATMCRTYGDPVGKPAAMSRALMWHHLASHVDAPTWLRRLDRTADQIEHCIDISAPMQYLGNCTAETDGEECGADIYARAGSPVGRCSRADCRTEYDTEASRANLEAALDARLYTATEIADLSTYLGLREKRDRVRDRVYQWKRRGRLVPHGTNADGDPVYRYGEVKALLAGIDSRA